ncbi:hypothetical protein [uncultured Acetatifactor sp.]|uniref:dienelactone hydrolase family protein n=1 Tax=uncultured Acetatifactor sp. TaxID=1671927 RepID=UPI00263282F7|nr:hypothetical protein [uncultured Acetatifactor sp.]
MYFAISSYDKIKDKAVPWSAQEAGAVAARAVRIVRASVSGSMDAFLCNNGPRMNHDSFDYDRAVYPPVFHAVGLGDFNVDNINKLYPELAGRGVTVEIHTFTGVPHGQAGRKLLDGYVKYPNFEAWEMLADRFMQNTYKT